MSANKSDCFKRELSFTQVSILALRDPNMSLKAKGLYCLMQSCIDEKNHLLSKENLMLICKEGTSAFNSAWKELKERGYLKQYRVPKGKNDSFVYEYVLLAEADLTTPSLTNLDKSGKSIN